jgi:flagellar hook protein FlgE
MSLFGSFNASVAGFRAQAQKMGTIADNIANAETSGYKTKETTFSSLVKVRGGDATGNHSGGVTSYTSNHLSGQGELRQTDRSLDVALDGTGFLLISDRSDRLGAVRTASFQVTKEGMVKSGQGLTLQGWRAFDNGTFDRDIQNTATLQNVLAIGRTSNAGQSVINSVQNEKGISKISGSVTANEKAEVLQTWSLRDTTGTERLVEGKVILNGVDNAFTFEISKVDGRSMGETISGTYDLEGKTWTSSGSGVTIPTADAPRIQFAVRGGATLDLDFSGLAVTEGNPVPIEVEEDSVRLWDASFVFESGMSKIVRESAVSWGGEEGTLQLEVSRATNGTYSGTLTISAGENTASAELTFGDSGRVSGYKITTEGEDPTSGNGAAVKGLVLDTATFGIDLSDLQITGGKDVDLFSASALSIDEKGVLSVQQADGNLLPLYQLALATCASIDQMTEKNGVLYASAASGNLSLGLSGQDGFATIISGTLEGSQTDLAHELAEMIRAQHAYAANTKVMSTLDEMLDQLERL